MCDIPGNSVFGIQPGQLLGNLNGTLMITRIHAQSKLHLEFGRAIARVRFHLQRKQEQDQKATERPTPPPLHRELPKKNLNRNIQHGALVSCPINFDCTDSSCSSYPYMNKQKACIWEAPQKSWQPGSQPAVKKKQ